MPATKEKVLWLIGCVPSMKQHQPEFMSWIVLRQRKVEMFCAVPIRGLFAPASATPKLAPRKGAATRR